MMYGVSVEFDRIGSTARYFVGSATCWRQNDDICSCLGADMLVYIRLVLEGVLYVTHATHTTAMQMLNASFLWLHIGSRVCRSFLFPALWGNGSPHAAIYYPVSDQLLSILPSQSPMWSVTSFAPWFAECCRPTTSIKSPSGSAN